MGMEGPVDNEKNIFVKLQEKAKAIIDNFRLRREVGKDQKEATEVNEKYDELKNESFEIYKKIFYLVDPWYGKDLDREDEQVQPLCDELKEKLEEARDYEQKELGMSKDSDWLADMWRSNEGRLKLKNWHKKTKEEKDEIFEELSND